MRIEVQIYSEDDEELLFNTEGYDIDSIIEDLAKFQRDNNA